MRQLHQAVGSDRPYQPTLDDFRLLPQARFQHRVLASRSGVVHRIATRALGFATMRLGAGRARVDSVIDPAVGVILHRKVGDTVAAGEPLCTLFANDPALIEREAHHFQTELFHVGDEPVTVPPLITQRL
jgi:thymidine phosphorylase